VFQGAADFIDFMKSVFGANEKERMTTPDGVIRHAEIDINGSKIMLGEPRPGAPTFPGLLYVYVPDCDAVYRRAIERGAKSIMEPADQFYGDRNAGVQDAWGNQWWIAQHKEDVPPEELRRRAASAEQKS
jgi:PhnB protein